MKLLILCVLTIGSISGCATLTMSKDCAHVENSDSVGNNKYVCRWIKPWE